jgi:hypothetical protein
VSKRTLLPYLSSYPYTVFSFLERERENQIARYFVKVESEADLDKGWPSNWYNVVPPKRKNTERTQDFVARTSTFSCQFLLPQSGLL